MVALFYPLFLAILFLVFLCLSLFPSLFGAAISLFIDWRKQTDTDVAVKRASRIAVIIYVLSVAFLCGGYAIYVFSTPFYIP